MVYFRQMLHETEYKNYGFDNLVLEMQQLVITKLSFVLNCLRETYFLVE